jgi:transposase
MNIRYVVELSPKERCELEAFVASGTKMARKLKRAQVLLGADCGVRDADIAESVRTSTSTIYRTKCRFVERGVEHALNDDPRPGARRKLCANDEALLVATACSKPPHGRARWTLELLAGEMVRLTHHEHLSRETIRRRLQAKSIKPWLQKMWCIPRVDAEFVTRMEDVLDLYAQRPNRATPVVCFDESPTQLIGEKRAPLLPAPGLPQRYDYEYRRNGTANLFVFLDAHRPWRHVKVTAQRTAVDFAQCMRDLVDVHYPNARKIRVVLDNLSTHKPAALYQAFPPAEARRILRMLEFHYTPKHASWLNMVEIEIGVLVRQCLDRRIADMLTLRGEVEAWNRQRNDEGAQIDWLFDVQRARHKMGRAYPKPTQQPVAQAA